MAKILMIDMNSTIDRRIILESEALIERGHDVTIVGMVGEDYLNGQNSSFVKIVRFPECPKEVLENLKIKDLRAATDQFLLLAEKLKTKIPTKLALLISLLLFPRFGLIYVHRLQSIPDWQRLVLRIFMSLQILKIKDALKLSAGLFKVIFTMNEGDIKCNFWENQVFKFATTNSFDVIHAHDYPSLRVATAIKKATGARLIYDAHELYSYQPGISSREAKRMLSKEKLLIRECDLCVVINDDQAEVMEKDFGYSKYVAFTNATKCPKEFNPTKKYDLVRKHLGIEGDNRPILIFQGGVNSGRKIDYLIHGVALSQARPRLVFLAWGPEIPEFQNLAKKLGVQDLVHFLPTVPWDEVIYWVASCDVGVMPYQALDLNTTLSSPNKMYEFIAAQVPMIGNVELVNVNKVLSEDGFGYCGPLSTYQDYAHAIDRVLEKNNYQRYKQSLQKNGEKYSFQSLISGLMNRYDELLQQPKN